jgi:hypothetical protein
LAQLVNDLDLGGWRRYDGIDRLPGFGRLIGAERSQG